MRIWNSGKTDDGAVHCLGNGKLAVYERGPEIFQVFGPPYSSPSFIQLLVGENEDIEVRSEREYGTAVWIHRIYKDGSEIGEMIDHVDAELPGIIRRLTLQQPLTLELKLEEGIETIDNTRRFEKWQAGSGMLLFAEAGIFIYNRYPNPKRIYHQITTHGEAAVSEGSDKGCRQILCGKGESILTISGGPDYNECIENAEKLLNISYDTSLERTRGMWKEFAGRRHNFEQMLSADDACRSSLLQAIDDVAVIIKTQQAVDGGILAGHNYHLAYVRDQYGTFRCLLKLGYYEEAKAVLQFYWNIWKRNGHISTAQGMGTEGLFHRHENDFVETTGYLIKQTFDYLEKTGEEAFIHEILPMLEWAWRTQKEQLVRYMLPFNGDETYIALGVLPRGVMFDGSAESTLLFILGGEKLLEWVVKNQLWSNEQICADTELLRRTREAYPCNFWSGKGISANNPERMLDMQLPRFRHGVCEICHDNMTWTEKNEAGRYVCPLCLNTQKDQEVPPKRYFIQSVSLSQLYLGSQLFSKEQYLGMVEEILHRYRETGKLPSKPEGDTTVGYDYGMLLYALNRLGHPFADVIYRKVMDIRDSTGAWVESYVEGKAFGTRCRPWESGINLEAAIDYVLGKSRYEDNI